MPSRQSASVIAVIGGAVLALSPLLPWYTADGDTFTAFEALEPADIAISALAGLGALLAIAAMFAGTPLFALAAVSLAAATAVAEYWALAPPGSVDVLRDVTADSRSWGGFVGFGAGIIACIAAILGTEPAETTANQRLPAQHAQS